MKDYAERINLDVNVEDNKVTIEIPIDLLEYLSRTDDRVMIEVMADSNIPFLPSLNVPVLIGRCFNDMVEELEDDLRTRQEEIDKFKKEVYFLNDIMLAQKEYIKRLEDIEKNYELKVVEQQKEIDKGKIVNKEVVDMAVEMTHFLFDRLLNKED